MVTKFKTYESMEWSDKYIISVPSGEIIYCSDNDIDALMLKNLIYYDNNRGVLSLYRWVCTDYLAPNVKEHIRRQSVPKPDFTLSPASFQKSLIIEFLLECGLEKGAWKIYDDMSVDTMGAVNMSNMRLKKIPVKFKRCASDFNCSNNLLETLENCPTTVHGNFNCSYNLLKNLIDGPRLVSKAYNCSYNELITLKGSPVKVRVFNCSYNQLRDLSQAPVVTDVFIKNNNYLHDKKI